MDFQDLMSALPRAVAEQFHDELDKIDIGPGASREDVLALLQRACVPIEYDIRYDDEEKTTLVKFVLRQLPKAALNALFPT